MTPLSTLAILILAAITALCLNAHDRRHARRMRSDNRLADLCRNLDRVMRDTQEDENR